MDSHPDSPTCAVIIPAAGRGTRFGSPRPKQYLELCGAPVVVQTVRRFSGHPRVAQIVLAVDAEELGTAALMLEQYALSKVELVAGGENRQESVIRALALVRAEQQLIAVHDSVRPLFSTALFDALLELGWREGAAIPLLPLTETIHRLRDGRVVDTPDRAEYGFAQTPQCFRTEVLREALRWAALHEVSGTDEAAIVRKSGHAVAVVAGESRNVKITHPHDLENARAWFGDIQ